MKLDEGARSFSVILSQLGDGTIHTDLSEALHLLNQQLSNHAEHFGKAKGALTLKLKIEAEAGGTVTVDADIATVTPKARRPRSTFWLTKGKNLTPENPRQQKLPLKEVPRADAARDIIEGDLIAMKEV